MIITDKIVELVLNLLEEPKIKDAIQKICSDDRGTKTRYSSSPTYSSESRYSSGDSSVSSIERDLHKRNEELARKLSEEQSENAKLKETNIGLSSKLENETQKLKKAESEKREVEEKLGNFQEENQKLNTKVESLEAEVEKRKNMYGKAQQAFDAFHSLSEADRDTLENTFRVDELASFIASGAKWENIEAIWDYARYEFNQGRLASRDNLLYILRFFLEVHNSAFYSYPKYKWQEVEEKEEFDAELYEKTPDSKTYGTIQKVLLPGIVLADESEEIIKKSLTQV